MNIHEPGRISSIVDEHATRESGIGAPIPTPQTVGEAVVLFVVLLLIGAGVVGGVLFVVGLFTTPDSIGDVVPVPQTTPTQQRIPTQSHSSGGSVYVR